MSHHALHYASCVFEGERVYDDALMLERAIMAEEMAKASECFITGTAAEVTPVSEIGPYRFTPGEVCRTLIADFNAAVQPRKGRRRVGRDGEEGRGIGCHWLQGGSGMLTVHHLGKSQSERIVWLCEELGIPYQLKRYERDPVTRLAPPEYKALHPLGAAPVITDGDVVLAESAAIIEYIVAKHGKGRLVLAADHPDFAQFLYWFHFANGTLQPALGRNMILGRLRLAEDNPILLAMKGRLDLALGLVEARLAKAAYFAGNEFTTADIMIVFSLTTMRLFLPFDLAPYPGIRAYLQRIGRRDAYRRAMRKGDPDMAPLLT